MGGFINSSGIQLLDEFGNPYGLKQVDGKIRVSAMPYLYDIAEGNVANHTPWAKIGYSVSTTGQTTMWNPGTEYVWPTIGQQLDVVSTDNTNDIAGGAGALTVRIGYLTIAGLEKTEVVTLTGTTVAHTVATDIYRINSFRVASTGASGKAAGTISLQRISPNGATKFAQIALGYTRARGCFYTVPAGKNLYISSIAFSAGYTTAGKYVRFTTQATYDNITLTALTPGVFFMAYNEVVLIDGAYTRALEIPTKLPAGTDLKVSVIGEASIFCTCSLRGWLETA